MAQRANGRTINIPGLHPQAVEDASRRWRSGVCFNLPDGRRHYIVSGPLHYQDGGAWQEIDNRWLPAVAPWAWQMVTAEYTARALSVLSAGQVLRLEKASHYVTYQPMALNWTNDFQQIAQVAMPAAIAGQVTNTGATSLCQQGRISWAGGYGAGRDFAYIPSTYFFRKELTIASAAALGSPPQYIIDGGNPVLSLEMIFSTDLDIYLDGELWNKQTRRVTAERIEFRDAGGALHWWWAVPRATDAASNDQAGTLEVRKSGNSLYVSVRIPWTWLSTAVYPIVIDPDVYYGETTDGYIYGQSTNYTTARTTSVASDNTSQYLTVGQLKSPAGGGTFFTARGYFAFNTSGMSVSASQVNLYCTVKSAPPGTDSDMGIHKCVWIDAWATAANREADYDAALASEKDQTWQNTANVEANLTYGSPNLATSWVDIDGVTYYAILSALDTGATPPEMGDDQRLQLYTQESTTEAYRPYLSITEGAPPEEVDITAALVAGSPSTTGTPAAGRASTAALEVCPCEASAETGAGRDTTGAWQLAPTSAMATAQGGRALSGAMQPGPSSASASATAGRGLTGQVQPGPCAVTAIAATARILSGTPSTGPCFTTASLATARLTTGELEAAPCALAGPLQTGRQTSGVLTIGTPTLTGAIGTGRALGGALQAGPATMTGILGKPSVLSGALKAAPCVLSGALSVPRALTGVLVAGPCTGAANVMVWHPAPPVVVPQPKRPRYVVGRLPEALLAGRTGTRALVELGRRLVACEQAVAELNERCVAMEDLAEGIPYGVQTGSILTEEGWYILDEHYGHRIALERGMVSHQAEAASSSIAMEDGGRILNETGEPIGLETTKRHCMPIEEVPVPP